MLLTCSRDVTSFRIRIAESYSEYDSSVMIKG